MRNTKVERLNEDPEGQRSDWVVQCLKWDYGDFELNTIFVLDSKGGM